MDGEASKLAFSNESTIFYQGRPVKRFMAVYRTVGCEYDKHGSGCTMCNFSHYRNPNATGDSLRAQHTQVLERLNAVGAEHFDLLTLGNFFNEREIDLDMRDYMLRSLSKVRSLKRVLVESRRCYINAAALREASLLLGTDIKLEFALGYESANAFLRNQILNKGLPERHLDETLELCAAEGISCCVYVLIKPQTLDEEQAVMDATNTALHVVRKAQQRGVEIRIAFEPVFVAGAVLEKAFSEGAYAPPLLWSVVDVLRGVCHVMKLERLVASLFVGLSDENLSEGRFPSGCSLCDSKLRAAIELFNATQDIFAFEFERCACSSKTYSYF